MIVSSYPQAFSAASIPERIDIRNTIIKVLRARKKLVTAISARGTPSNSTFRSPDGIINTVSLRGLSVLFN